MHLSTQPLFKASSKQSCWHAILRHLKQRGHFLFCQEDIYVVNQLLCAAPFARVNQDSHTSFVHNILIAEYGEDILSEISRPFLTRKQSVNACVKANKLEKKMKEQMSTFKIVTEIKTSWPHKVSHEIIFKRLNEYFEGTMWALPPLCAVCSWQIHDCKGTSIIADSNTSTLPHHLDILLITDPFMFGYKALNGLMLYKLAVHPWWKCDFGHLYPMLFISLKSFYAQIWFSQLLVSRPSSLSISWSDLGGGNGMFMLLAYCTYHVFFNLVILYYQMFYMAVHVHMEWMWFPLHLCFHTLLWILMKSWV